MDEAEAIKEETAEETYVPKRKRGKKARAFAKPVVKPSDRPKRARKKRKVLQQAQPIIWTVVEKEKLLEGLYRYSPVAFESISNMIETKTPKQVEEYISKLSNSSIHGHNHRYVEIESENTAAPIELWLSLLEEITRSEYTTDISKHYTKVMEVITRNEPMTDNSGFADLKWKNIYQFICDLLFDKPVPNTNLSNLESLIVLDLMHNVGETVHLSDTKQQRRLLDLKYQLYQWQVMTKNTDYACSMAAIHNDYSKILFTPHFTVDGCKMPKPSTSTDPQPSTSNNQAGTSSNASDPKIGSTISNLTQGINNPIQISMNPLSPKSEIVIPIVMPSTSSSQMETDPIPSTSTQEVILSVSANSEGTSTSTNENNSSGSTSEIVIPISMETDPIPPTSTQEVVPSVSTGDEGTSTSTNENNSSLSEIVIPVSTPSPHTNGPSTSSMSEQQPTTSMDGNCPSILKNLNLQPTSNNDNGPSTSHNDEPEDNEDNNGEEEVDDKLGDIPSLFSLNPLTIPAHLLTFGFGLKKELIFK